MQLWGPAHRADKLNGRIIHISSKSCKWFVGFFQKWNLWITESARHSGAGNSARFLVAVPGPDRDGVADRFFWFSGSFGRPEMRPNRRGRDWIWAHRNSILSDRRDAHRQARDDGTRQDDMGPGTTRP
jgi:hypothetical protein